MQPIPLRRQAEVGTVVHYEPDTRPETRPEFTRLLKHAASVARFVAILQQRASGGRQVRSSVQQFPAAQAAGSIEDRVQTGQ
jgi:hypothetical protein